MKMVVGDVREWLLAALGRHHRPGGSGSCEEGHGHEAALTLHAGRGSRALMSLAPASCVCCSGAPQDAPARGTRAHASARVGGRRAATGKLRSGLIRALTTWAMALAAATIALELIGTPMCAEAAQPPASLPCDVANGWNAWNGDSTAWACSGGAVTVV